MRDDLDPHDLRRLKLLVQVLDDANKVRREAVTDEQKAKPVGRDFGLHLHPERVLVLERRALKERLDHLGGLAARPCDGFAP